MECGLRVVVKREIRFYPEAESLVPENCPLLRLPRREKSWLQMLKPKLTWGFLKLPGAGNHLEATQKEKARAPRAPPTSNCVTPPQLRVSKRLLTGQNFHS